MGEIVNLHGLSVGLENDLEFVSDLARFRENLLDEKAIRKKYRLANDVWEKLADDDALIRKVEEESTRRIRDGSSKREKAQKLIVRAPDILGKIMDDDNQSARHRIDSCKVLNEFAANGPAGVPAADRFLIQINLGSDTLTFNKSIRPLEPGEIDPDDSSPDVDAGVVAVIATKKSQDGGNGNAL
jgi:hypothetical protein